MFALLFRFLLLAAGISLSFAADLDREIVLAPHDGTDAVDAEIRACQARAGATTAKVDDFVRLGWAFVAKARCTLDAGYYKLAEKAAEVTEARFGASAESRLLRGNVYENLHRFREAEAVARVLVNERGEPEDFGLLSDALMEQGRLTESIDALQRMMNLKPDTAAYSRVAHLRWLKGDLRGAIAAMETAASATSPQAAETCAWVYARLAGFYLQAGRPDASLRATEVAAKRAANYPPALLARGRALLALGKSEAAVAALTRAAELNPLPEYQWWLTDALRVVGRDDEAGRVEAKLKAAGEASDPRTLALYLATRGDSVPTARRLAREELATRADVFTHDALAWALFASGDLTAAETEMQAALAEHTADARLFLHAGEIELARGARVEAEKYFAQARPLAAALTPSERARLDARLKPAAVAATILPLQQSHPQP